MRRGAPIDLVASDPLARVYEALLAEANLAPPVRTTFALAEDLSVFFDHSSFDAVHCRNALDHSFDPMKGVLEMLRVVRPGRAVVLIHRQNEAESENYTGFHQYNFSMNAGRFTIWNKSETWDVAEQIPIRVQIECETAHGMINVRITKQEEFTDSDDRSRHRLRLRAMLTAMFDHIIDRETAGVPAQALPD
jgi:SAM-dependent methyltransferase